MARNITTLPMRVGGLGSRSAVRTAPGAFWASWADALPMLQQRLARLTGQVMHHLSHPDALGCLGELQESVSRPAKAVSGKNFPQPRRGDFRGERTCGEVGGCDQCVGRGRHPAVTGLKEALRQARLQAQVRPVDDRIKATKMFIERSRKRVDSVGEEVTKAQEAVLEAQAKLTKEEEALEDGLKRLNSLQQEADGLPEQPPPPTAPADFARELAKLRACVQALQVERDDLRAEVARQNVEGRSRKARSLAVPSPDLVMGDNSMQSPSVLAIRSSRNSSSVMETLIDQADSSVKSNHRFHPMKQSGIEAFRRSTVCGGSVLVKHLTGSCVTCQIQEDPVGF